jgi:hypothetical protein
MYLLHNGVNDLISSSKLKMKIGSGVNSKFLIIIGIIVRMIRPEAKLS